MPRKGLGHFWYCRHTHAHTFTLTYTFIRALNNNIPVYILYGKILWKVLNRQGRERVRRETQRKVK